MSNKRFLKKFNSQSDYESQKDSVMGIPHVVLFEDTKKIAYKPIEKETPSVDYSKEYFTIKTNAYVGVQPIENISGEIFYKKLNLHPNNTNTYELEWHTSNYEYGFYPLWPGEKVIIKSNPINVLNYEASKLKIYLYPYAPELIENLEIIIQGNIASLVYGDDFIGKTIMPIFDGEGYSSNKYFEYFFMDSHITDASNLILPFVYDENTNTGPSYKLMFKNNIFLKYGPKELPATTLADCCYFGMFNGCTSLTSAPALPATTLADGCYYGMFQGCTSLTSALALPATTLAIACYESMFIGCSKLSSITMLATDISASNCLFEWVNGVSSNGTFIKHPSMTTLPNGTRGIPNGWAVEDYKE